MSLLRIFKGFETASSDEGTEEAFKTKFLKTIRQPQQRELARVILNKESIPSKYSNVKIAEMREKIRWARKGIPKYCESCSIANLK